MPGHEPSLFQPEKQDGSCFLYKLVLSLTGTDERGVCPPRCLCCGYRYVI